MGSLDVTSLSQLIRLRLGADLPHTLMARIHAVCDGNPFYGLEIGHALLERDALPAPGEPLPIPDDLRTLLGSRLASLPAGVRDTLLLVAAAVHPTIRPRAVGVAAFGAGEGESRRGGRVGRDRGGR